jgi:glycosyltransferase involved in cell wall biosynthesis
MTRKKDMIDVCLLVYRRLEYLDAQIEQLSNQTYKDFNLFIWNNSKESLKKYDTDFPIHVFGNNRNDGFQARLWAATKGTADTLLFLDDDLDMRPHMIECYRDFYDYWGGEAVVGGHTKYFMKEEYWVRTKRPPRPESRVDYIGPGGMILPRALLNKEPSLQDMPDFCKFADDLYLSYCARKHGYDLRWCPKYYKFIIDDKASFGDYGEYKQNAFLTLRGMGWKLMRELSEGYGEKR